MAGFAEGFTFEIDVSAPLTIEGNPVKGFRKTKRGFSARLPRGQTIRAETLAGLVEDYVQRSGLLRERTKRRRSHLRHLRKGRDHWNEWRRRDPAVQPMLAGVKAADFGHRRLNGYDFSYTNFTQAQLQGVSMAGANFHQAILAKADLTGADLEGANFCRTDLYETNFHRARLTGANLQGVQLVRTVLTGADLRRCKVYGLSAWDLDVKDESKHNHLIIKYKSDVGKAWSDKEGSEDEEKVIVDGVDLAAFMYATLNNRNIARIIDGASRQWVLILGRFTEGGKEVLEAVRTELKARHYIPIIFDFERPNQRDLIETLMLLAGMSAFIIVDISNPRSTPLELQAIASNYGIPIFPIIRGRAEAFGMFAGLRKFRWVSQTLRYDDDLRSVLADKLIPRAEKEISRLTKLKKQAER